MRSRFLYYHPGQNPTVHSHVYSEPVQRLGKILTFCFVVGRFFKFTACLVLGEHSGQVSHQRMHLLPVGFGEMPEISKLCESAFTIYVYGSCCKLLNMY